MKKRLWLSLALAYPLMLTGAAHAASAAVNGSNSAARSRCMSRLPGDEAVEATTR